MNKAFVQKEAPLLFPLAFALPSTMNGISEETQAASTDKACSRNAYLVEILSRLRRNNSFLYINQDSIAAQP